MGQCSSCIRRFLPFLSDIEMSNTENMATSDELLAEEAVPQVHEMDAAMSAPTITIANDLKNVVTGFGLALADVPVEQDSAYWEWRISNHAGDGSALMFGVSNKRNIKFYEILAESTVPPEKHGTKFMSPISNMNDGDVVGVLVQQSEIPMIQLYVNGEIQDRVSRFRGTVFPAVYLPQGTEMSAMSATFLYRENQFIRGPPVPGIPPLMAERSLM